MSTISAGHGLSFPLQHNLGDDTAYSMMHVPQQPVTVPPPANVPPRANVPPQAYMPPPHWNPALGHPAAPAGSVAAGWYPNGLPPMSSIPPALAPVFAPTAIPAAVPHSAAVSEQRLHDLLEAIVARYMGSAQKSPAIGLEVGARPAAAMGQSISSGWLVAILVALILLIGLVLALLISLLLAQRRPALGRGRYRSARMRRYELEDEDEPDEAWVRQASKEAMLR